MQSTFKKIRKRLIIRLFEKSQKFYVKYFKKHKIAWNITKHELLNYSKDTLGYQYIRFLIKNNFEILPKLERHDAYHVITGYKSEVQDEIALQYLCFGNGKRSIYLFGVILLGTILLPDYVTYYRQSYRIGKQANPFYNLDYEKLLATNLEEIQTVIFSKKSRILINNKRIIEQP